MLSVAKSSKHVCKCLQVFRCSEPDGYELLAVLPGMSIDDIR